MNRWRHMCGFVITKMDASVMFHMVGLALLYLRVSAEHHFTSEEALNWMGESHRQYITKLEESYSIHARVRTKRQVDETDENNNTVVTYDLCQEDVKWAEPGFYEGQKLGEVWFNSRLQHTICVGKKCRRAIGTCTNEFRWLWVPVLLVDRSSWNGTHHTSVRNEFDNIRVPSACTCRARFDPFTDCETF
ncbi:unnamed protein product [Owenia fusiformis]|uniref:Uncharacterized protein n=1 Tax=Owenia fusiformis TaxID=6347 RepID=A0A8J1XTX0_OWEFU|nr:unnamed protein product [Owenia fusiformis]